MELFVGYMLRASVYLLLFAVAYKIMLSRKVNPSFNRFFLLGSGFFSLVLSLPHNIELALNSSENSLSTTYTLPEIIITATTGYSQTAGHIATGISAVPPARWLLLILSFGMGALLLWQLSRLLMIIIRFKGRKHQGLTLIELPYETPPFSFFHWFFVPQKALNVAEFETILAHEKAHFRRLHSVDVIFFELLRILFWFHPAFYYLRHELRAMHEFEADSIVLAQHDKTAYQQSLLTIHLSGGLIPVTNPFNVSLIKKRMLMMNQQKWQKPARNWFKIMFLMPFVLTAVVIQSCQMNSTETTSSDAKESQAVVAEYVADVVKTEELATVTSDSITDEVFTVVETMPEFPGGGEAMIKFMVSNIRYPESARKDTVQGKVFVNFIVDKNGKVSNVKVIRGIGHGCDEEAARVVAMMPDWTPGQQRGKNVNVSFNLPVTFKLN
ncbi:MAG: TonB [Bacteroidetes bacterium]|nr:MAG: TonB [Bacteroidota bacterium]